MRNSCLLGLTALVVMGCGGGGGSSSHTEPAANGQAAAVIAAQGAVVYGGGANGLAGTPALATAGQSASAWAPFTVEIAKAAVSAFGPPKTRGTWTEIGTSGIYYETVTETSTTGKILLSTNGTSNNAGYVSVAVTSGQVGAYPETANLNLDITLDGQTITGTETLTVDDALGENFTLKGTESSSAAGVTVTFNLSEQNGTLSGSLTVIKGSSSVTLANFSASASGFSSSIVAGNIQGSVTVNSDGSGTASATDSSGEWTVTWDSGQNATLTSPTGATTTGTLQSLAA